MASLLVRPVLLVALLLLASTAHAAAEADPRIHEDAAPCLAGLDARVDAIEEQTTTCVVAYAHMSPKGAMSGMLNVQRPPGGIDAVEAGIFQPPVTQLWDLPAWRFEIQQGLVEYSDQGLHFTNPGALDSVVALHPEVPLHVRLHFTVDQKAIRVDRDDTATSAGVAPCVTVRADLRASSDRESMGESLTSGQTIVHLARPGAAAPDLPCARPEAYEIDEDGITSLEIILPPPARGLERGEGARVHITAYHERPDGDHSSVTGIRLVHDADHLNHVVFALDDAIRIETIHPVWSEGAFFVRTDVSSPWGDYDVDQETLDLQVLDANGDLIASRSGGEIDDPAIRYLIYHDKSDSPLKAAFHLDPVLATLADGTYTIRVIAENGQHTGRTTADATFRLSADGARLTFTDLDGNTTTHGLREDAEAPLPDLLPLLGLLGLAAAAHYRRRR